MMQTYITIIMLLAFAGLGALCGIGLLLRQLRTILKDLADDVDLLRSNTNMIASETHQIAAPFVRAADEEFDAWVKEHGLKMQHDMKTNPMEAIISAVRAFLQLKRIRRP